MPARVRGIATRTRRSSATQSLASGGHAGRPRQNRRKLLTPSHNRRGAAAGSPSTPRERISGTLRASTAGVAAARAQADINREHATDPDDGTEYVEREGERGHERLPVRGTIKRYYSGYTLAYASYGKEGLSSVRERPHRNGC